MERLWLDREPRAAWQQMAVDCALVDWSGRTGTAILRLYRWREDTLSLGANEAATRTWHRAALERDGIACVRRPSGGRGVWHADSDLTYAWSGPAGGPAGVRQRYRDLHDRLAAAISRCGVVTALAAAPLRSPGLESGACFDAAVGGEILIHGRKRVGSAQKVIGSMLLQHGAIALGAGEAGGRYRLVQHGTAHSSQDGPILDAVQVADAVLDSWSREGAEAIESGAIDEIVAASRTHEARFRDPEWTWRR